MNYKVSDHAKNEIKKRNIPEDVLTDLLLNPQQKVKGFNGRRIFQSIYAEKDKKYLLRVIIEQNQNLVVTLYKTSKIDKYWEK